MPRATDEPITMTGPFLVPIRTVHCPTHAAPGGGEGGGGGDGGDGGGGDEGGGDGGGGLHGGSPVEPSPHFWHVQYPSSPCGWPAVDAHTCSGLQHGRYSIGRESYVMSP